MYELGPVLARDLERVGFPASAVTMMVFAGREIDS